jgi:hypothetical protein
MTPKPVLTATEPKSPAVVINDWMFWLSYISSRPVWPDSR